MLLQNCFALLFLAGITWQRVLAAAPASINLGGIFSQLNSAGLPDANALQAQAAFIIAVNQINNKTDGIFDDILPDTMIKIAVRHTDNKQSTVKAMSSLLDATIGGEKVQAIVNGLSDDVSTFEYAMAEYAEVFVLRAVTPETLSTTTPGRVSLQPNLAQETTMLQFMMCTSNTQELAVISDGGAESLEAMNRLTDGLICPVNVLSTTVVGSSSSFDMLSGLSPLRDSRFNVYFLLLSDPAVTGRVLETAYDLGLFREGVLVFLSGSAASSDIWKLGMTTGADVPSMMRGDLAFKYTPNFSLLNTAAGMNFISQWSEQQATHNATGMCNAAVDDSLDSHPLYISYADGVTCAGLDFSLFASPAQLSTRVSSVYDAVVAFAVGMHFRLVQQNAPLPTTTTEYLQTMIYGVNSNLPLGW
jgi:hypothetical protein